jgi:hypothetical protein
MHLAGSKQALSRRLGCFSSSNSDRYYLNCFEWGLNHHYCILPNKLDPSELPAIGTLDPDLDLERRDQQPPPHTKPETRTPAAADAGVENHRIEGSRFKIMHSTPRRPFSYCNQWWLGQAYRLLQGHYSNISRRRNEGIFINLRISLHQNPFATILHVDAVYVKPAIAGNHHYLWTTAAHSHHTSKRAPGGICAQAAFR